MLEGYGLVTCAHNLVKEQAINVWRWDEWVDGEKPATPIHVENDPEVDIAILQIPNMEKFHALKVGDSDRLKERDAVTVSGLPKYHRGDQPLLYDAKVAGRREFKKGRIQRIIIDKTNDKWARVAVSALNSADEIIGIIVTGALNVADTDEIADYGIIPI